MGEAEAKPEGQQGQVLYSAREALSCQQRCVLWAWILVVGRAVLEDGGPTSGVRRVKAA